MARATTNIKIKKKMALSIFLWNCLFPLKGEPWLRLALGPSRAWAQVGSGLQLGPPLPHAPGARMTVVKQTPSKLYGRLGPLGVCKTYVAAPLAISTIGELILRTFSFRLFPNMFRPSQLDPHFTNSSSNNGRAIAPSLTLTYPERCASKFCVRTCRKLN